MLVYDSTNPYDIPASVPAVAPYVDGLYGPEHKVLGSTTGWDAAAIARFPNAIKIGIAVNAATNDGRALDVEQYDATPAQAPAWVKMRRAAGVAVPLVYCNRSNRSAVESALSAAGIGSDQVALWVATLDGTKTVPAGPYPVAMVQYANSVIAGGHYDISITTAFGDASGQLGGDMATEQDIINAIQSTGLQGGVTSLYNAVVGPGAASSGTMPTTSLLLQLEAISAKLDKLAAPAADPALTQAITDLTAVLQRLEAGFKAA